MLIEKATYDVVQFVVRKQKFLKEFKLIKVKIFITEDVDEHTLYRYKEKQRIYDIYKGLWLI